MTNENDFQVAIQTSLRSSSLFADEDVVINDYSFLDRSIQSAPYAMIKTADNFEIIYSGPTAEQRWDIPVHIYIAFEDHDISLEDMKTVRTNVIDTLGGDTGGVVGLALRAIRPGTEVLPVYNAYVAENEIPEMLPIFYMQELIIECEVF